MKKLFIILALLSVAACTTTTSKPTENYDPRDFHGNYAKP